MATRRRVEIIGRDRFWQNAVMVEWDYQFPERKLVPESDGTYLIEPEWLTDLERVAKQCFSKVILAPTDPSRRQWFRRFVPHSREE